MTPGRSHLTTVIPTGAARSEAQWRGLSYRGADKRGPSTAPPSGRASLGMTVFSVIRKRHGREWACAMTSAAP